MARLSRGSRWFVVVIVLGLAGVGGGLYVLDGRLGPIGGPDVEPGQPVEIEVEPGTSVRAVGDQLAEVGVVASGLRFRLSAEEADLSDSLQPGVFAMETAMGIDAAIGVLAAGPTSGAITSGTSFTVPEGLTVAQTLEELAGQLGHLDVDDFRAVLDERADAGGNEDGVLELPDWVPEPAEAGEEVIEPYEGLLFPQTYQVADDASALTVLQRMVDQLATTSDQVPQDALDGLEERGLTRYDGLVLASLIERETRVDAERGLVSGVLENRLADQMRLQIDATVLYARDEPTDQVLFEDTEIDSPYNTYAVDGLPPTPISGVGEASFLAAYRPQETSALFYVLDAECDGTHEFAETLEEHNDNVAAFRETDGCGVTADS